MPRIVPLQLLKCLKVLLDDNGGILSESEVKRIAGLMTKYSKKLVSKCIYVQILKCTKTELLGEFMGAGGWSLTHLWLNDAIRAMNWPLVQEILELLLLCPVDVDRLKSNSAPKLVKGLCKDGGNEGVRILAVKLVEQWLKVVTSDTAAPVPRLNSVPVAAPTLLKSVTSQTSSSSATEEVGSQQAQALAVTLPEMKKKKNSESTEDEDPLADVDEVPPISYSLTAAQKKASESGLIYKIVVKDGQQVFAKIESKNKINVSECKEKQESGSNQQDKTEYKSQDNEEIDCRQSFDAPDNTYRLGKIENAKESNSKPSTLKESSNSEDENSNSVECKFDDAAQCAVIDKDISPAKKPPTEEEKLKNDLREYQKSHITAKKEEKLMSLGKDKKSNESDRRSSSSSHRSISTSSSHKSSSKSSSSSNKSRSSSSAHRNSADGKQISTLSNREKDKEKDRSNSASSTTNKEKDSKEKSSKDGSTKHKSSSGKSSSSSSKDKHREKTSFPVTKPASKILENKDKEFSTHQLENNKETLTKMTSTPLEKFGRIPKKPREEDNSNNNNITKPTSITIPSKKASMSIEIRRDNEKTKTVKTYKSQFRSHGLTEEAPPPPSRKGLKKPTSVSLPGTAIPASLPSLKKPSSPTNSSSGSNTASRDSPVEKKAKIDINNLSVHNEKPGAIKLIAPKPKIQTLVETNLFSDALSAATGPKKDARKRKKPNSVQSANKDIVTSPISPDVPKLTPLKFYQDTLDENKDEEKNTATPTDASSTKTDKTLNADKDADSIEDDDDIPLKKVKDDIEEKVRREMNKTSNADSNMSDDTDPGINSTSIKTSGDSDQPIEVDPEAPRKPGPGCGPNGPPGVLMLHRRKGPKKKLMWRPLDQLEQIRYFDLDETERVNVTKNFIDMKNLERFSERDAINMSRRGFNHEDNMEAQIPWKALVLIDDVPPQPEGNNSKERKVQADREQTTLRALYFSHAMIPDSPAEPDIEPHQPSEFTIIPLDDITANPDAVNDFTSMPWPDPKGSPQHENLRDDGGSLIADMYGSVVDVCGGSNNPFNPFLPFGSQSNSDWPLNSAPPGPMPSNINRINSMNMGPPGIMCGPGVFNTPMGPSMGLMGGPPSPSYMDGIGGGSMMGCPSGPMGNGIPGNMVVGMGGLGGHNQFGGPIRPQQYPGQNFATGGGNFGPPIMNMPMNGSGPSIINGPMNMCVPGPMNGPISNDGNRRGGISVHRGGSGSGGGSWRSGGSNFGNEGNWRSGNSTSGHSDRGSNLSNRGKDNWMSNNGNVCKQYARSGSCRLGNKCKFLHPGKGGGNKNRY